MRKFYSLNVKLGSGAEFVLKVNGEDIGEVTAWLDGLDSVFAHSVMGSASPSPRRTKTENGIAAARREKGWTQQELADAIGVAQQHVQRWEAGVHRPSIEVLMKMGDALGVEWTTLVEPQK